MISLVKKDLTVVHEGEVLDEELKLMLGPGTGLGGCLIKLRKGNDGKIHPDIHGIEAAHSVYTIHDDIEKEYKEFYMYI